MNKSMTNDWIPLRDIEMAEMHREVSLRPVQRSHDAASLADLQTAIIEFEKALPGWWYSLGICSVSRDASCGPDITGPDAALLEIRQFDGGFH